MHFILKLFKKHLILQSIKVNLFFLYFFSRCRYCIKAKNKPTVNDNIDMTDFYDDDYDLDDDDYEDEDDEAGDDTDDSGNGKS